MNIQNQLLPRLILTAVVLITFIATPVSSVSAAYINYDRMITRVVPEVLDDQVVYPTNHATLALTPLRAYTWESVTVPPEWLAQGYYFEIWDTANKPVPGFHAQGLNYESQLNIESIDASLYPQIRLVVFVRPDSPPINYQQAVYFTYHEESDQKLFVFLGMITALYLGLGLGALHYRLSVSDLATGTARLLRRGLVKGSGREFVLLGWLTVVWVNVFGIVMSHFVGGAQIFYVLIKLPFLMLAALLVTAISLILLSLLLGVRAPAKQILAQATQLVATTSLALASLSPLLLFYIYLPMQHNALLLSTVTFFAISGSLAAWQLWAWLGSFKVKARAPVTVLWVCLYGFVFLQLGWLMRPWIGVIDDVQNTVPFMRSQSGNVFIELGDTVKRL